jgi:hypothetical protein
MRLRAAGTLPVQRELRSGGALNLMRNCGTIVRIAQSFFSNKERKYTNGLYVNR